METKQTRGKDLNFRKKPIRLNIENMVIKRSKMIRNGLSLLFMMSAESHGWERWFG